MANGDLSIHKVIDIITSLCKGKVGEMGVSAGQIVWLAIASSMHLKNNCNRYIYILRHRMPKGWIFLDPFKILVSAKWKSASTLLWLVGRVPCARATGQSLVT